MRIILDASVSTVKRLRVSLGTLVAIEATAAANTAVDEATTARAAASAATTAGPAASEAAARRAAQANADVAAGGMSLAGASCTDVISAATIIAEVAIERAFQAIEQINRLMHPRAEGSDLARISNAPLHTPAKIHPSVGRLLNLAKRINTLTEGIFDPCTPAQPGRLGDIEISADETEVMCHARVALDFGGFAKGYAVDCAVEALMATGCTAGLVNAGGDLRVFGQRADPVFVRGPAGELTNIELVDVALAVSDAASQQQPPEHQGYYVRGLDIGAPTAGTQAVRGVGYAAVIASTAVVADALAKCVLLCPPAVANRTLRALGAFEPLANHKSSAPA
jgi:thiamine biosynthesis lipoprotein